MRQFSGTPLRLNGYSTAESLSTVCEFGLDHALLPPHQREYAEVDEQDKEHRAPLHRRWSTDDDIKN